MKGWLRLALRKDVAARAAKVSLVVGTLLAVINQGDVLVRGAVTAGVVTKIILTYLVPYGVATFASVQALRQQSKQGRDL